jgi:hypothetical protein
VSEVPARYQAMPYFGTKMGGRGGM